MASNIESMLKNPEILPKAFNDIRTSIDILKQIELGVPLTDYKGEKYSKEEGDKIIELYSQKYKNHKTLKIIQRVKSTWDYDYEKIKREIYSNLVKK